MLVKPLPILNEDKLVQRQKASVSIKVTLSGIVTEVKAEQPQKAPLPMLFTLLPIVTEVRLEQPLKALSPMAVTRYSKFPFLKRIGMVILPEYFVPFGLAMRVADLLELIS